MPLVITIIASLLGGGLSGACVSVFFNRLFQRQDLRTKFYPVLNNMHSAYVIRMQNPDGQYWKTIVGNVPSPQDEDFIDHRATFLGDLVQYCELKEVRVLRQKMMDNAFSGDHEPGEVSVLDLTPESAALSDCLFTLHKRLKLLR